MEQSASAAAMPAANRRTARTRMFAVLCAASLQAAASPTQADDMSSVSSGASKYVQHAMLETPSSSQIQLAVYGVPPFVTQTVKPSMSFNEVAIPAPKRSAIASLATTLPTRALKPTILFGSMGRSVSLTPVTKRWHRALGSFALSGTPGAKQPNDFKSYRAILDQVKDERRARQIPKVNFMVNRLLSYRDDIHLWKAREYWASPVESLTRRAGDCEDYAILKYALLRDLGVADKDMRIVVLRDTAARQYHAVLSVKHDGKWLVLDNRFSRVRFERDLPNYKVLYTVNAEGQWAHEQDKKAPIRLAAKLKSLTR